MLQKFPFQAGIIKDDPPLTAEGYWGDGKNVRFYRGKPEPVKGWSKFITSAVTGKARKLANWSDLSGNSFLAIGTNLKLHVVTGDTLYNITPYDENATGVSVTLATVSGTPTVTITDTAHGRVQGDYVNFTNQSAAVGGITLSGDYNVVTVVDSNNYTVTHGSNASSTASAGVTIDLKYELNIAEEVGVAAYGWGASTYGTGTWGTERAGGFSIFPRTWSIEGFGQYVLANPYGGKLYVWDGNASNRATVASGAPDRIDGMFTTPERFVVLLGTKDIGGTYQPLLVRWADQETYTSWTPSATNAAGEYPLSFGNRIIGGQASKLQNLIWTDTALYGMRYIGDNEFIFGFDLLGTNCGLISPTGFAQRDGVAFWMSPQGQFFFYDGGTPKVINCPIRKYVFNDINFSQFRIISCGLDSEYNEVIWFYASNGSNVINRCVAYNYVDDTWWIGDIARTAWLDKSLFERAIAVDNSGYIYNHNMGNSADGSAIDCYIETAPFDVADGELTINVAKIVPDFDVSGGNVTVTLSMKRWPNDTTEQTKTLTFTPTSTRLDTRAQGRVAKLRFSSNDANTAWRLGDIRLDVAPVGKR